MSSRLYAGASAAAPVSSVANSTRCLRALCKANERVQNLSSPVRPGPTSQISWAAGSKISCVAPFVVLRSNHVNSFIWSLNMTIERPTKLYLYLQNKCHQPHGPPIEALCNYISPRGVLLAKWPLNFFNEKIFSERKR